MRLFKICDAEFLENEPLKNQKGLQVLKPNNNNEEGKGCAIIK